MTVKLATLILSYSADALKTNSHDQKKIYCILRELYSAVVDGQPIYKLHTIKQSRILIALTGNMHVAVWARCTCHICMRDVGKICSYKRISLMSLSMCIHNITDTRCSTIATSALHKTALIVLFCGIAMQGAESSLVIQRRHITVQHNLA